MQETPSPPLSLETARSYLAPAVPGSIPLFYLFLLLLPLFRGGGLRKVLGLAELLGSLRHGAAATVAAAAPVTVAPALLSFALPPVVPVSSSLCPPSPVAYYLFSGGHHDMCVYKASSWNVCVQIIVCKWMILMLQQPQDSLQQPQRKMLQLVVLMLLACAAAATHPVSLHCAELPPLPLLSFLPSTLLSSLLPLLAQTSHAVLCSARWGSCCRAPSFYLSNVLLFMLLCLFRHSFPPWECFFFDRSCCLILHK